MRRLKKPLIYAGLFSATAVSGAWLSSHFEYRYQTHNYQERGIPRPYVPERVRDGLRAEIERLGFGPLSDRIVEEVALPRVFLYGAAPPMESRLEISGNLRTIRTTYWFLWPNDHLIPKMDWEPLTLVYSVSGDSISLERVFVRPHNQTAEYSKTSCGRLNERSIPIAIGNPSHSLGIPDCNYMVQEWGAIQAFTKFAHENWAGASIAWGWPQEMGPIGMNLTVGRPPQESDALRTPYYRE
jgi:hypothetical protein